MANEDTKTPRNYQCSTAKVVSTHNGGNIPMADIMEDADRVLKSVRSDYESLQQDYWEHHQRILNTSFHHLDDQLNAMLKLAEMAIALKALADAQSALTKVRCFN